jgi:putative hydrolase of the HAD superfamily
MARFFVKTQTSMIKAVLFDLDDTLLDREASVLYFIEQQYERLRQLFNGVPQDRFVRRFLELDDHGYVTKDIVYQQLELEFGLTGVWQELLADYMSNFDDYCINLPGVNPMLDTLQAQNRQLGIITNGPSPFQEKKIEAMGIAPYFSAILVSTAEGVRKPDAEIFRRALLRLGVEPHEAVFVGDNPKADIAGAQAFGMKAVWKRVDYWQCASADAVVEDLTRLPAIVQQLEV